MRSLAHRYADALWVTVQIACGRACQVMMHFEEEVVMLQDSSEILMRNVNAVSWSGLRSCQLVISRQRESAASQWWWKDLACGMHRKAIDLPRGWHPVAFAWSSHESDMYSITHKRMD